MDFAHTEERRLLQETLRRFFADAYSIEKRMEVVAGETGYCPKVWAQMAELGVIGALFAEADGGFGGGGFDLAVVFEEVGRAGAVEPLLASGVLAGGVVAALGSEAQRAVLEGVIGGAETLALAHSEPESHYDLGVVVTSVRAADGGFVLDGHKAVVLNGDSADHLVVSARSAGAVDEPDKISAFLVPADAAGLHFRAYPTIDGGRAVDLTLSGAKVPPEALLGEEGAAFPAIERAVAAGLVALCAEALGAMETAKDLTLDYLKTREQFGKPIGSFQALQHRMVEMLVEIEQMRSAVINAAAALDGPRAAREKAVSAAKNLAGRVGRLVAEESIQMHGGIGVTWDYALPHFAKRLVMIDHILGDADHHMERVADLMRAE